MKVPIHYLSYDRFPAAKGAAVHINAFVRGLATAFGNIRLTTVASRELAQRQGATVSTEATGNADSTGTTGRTADTTTYSEPLTQYCDSVWHKPILVTGRNLIERVSSFRQQMLHNWEHSRIVHFRSIYEGYPLAREKKHFCDQIVFEVNGLPSIELKYHYPNVADDSDLLRKLRYQEQVCLDAADLVVTVSPVNAEHLVNSRGVAPEKLRVIPNGVDTDLFPVQLPTPVGNGPLRCLYVGTLAPWQGIRVAIEGVALYLRDHPVKLTIVGDGRSSQRKSLLQLIDKLDLNEHVQILPPMNQADLAALYHASHCAFAPLLGNDRNRVQGCCPLKVLEAMACGTTLIASDLEVVRTLARNGIEAILVRTSSAKAIKDAMLRIKSEPRLSVRLAAAARRRAKQLFTWHIAQAKLIEAYVDVLDIKPRTTVSKVARSRSG